MKLRNVLLMVLCTLSLQSFAQSKHKEIRFLDAESGLPIEQATYTYGDQNGITDERGAIQFLYTTGGIMELSHVSYGTWSLTDQEILQAIDQGISYHSPAAVNLFPVMIIAMKPQSTQPQGDLEIEQQERLEHDAANILNQLPAFNSIRKGGHYGFEPVFRGFKYDQLNIVMNGAQSATAACPNRMDPPTSQMAPNMMDRIEILKGPHALRYGTGLGATINFIPANLRFSTQPAILGRLSSGYESNGNVIRGETQLGLTGEKYDISLFGSWSTGDDYTTGANQTVPADFSRGSFGSQMGFKLGSDQQLRLSATYNRARDADFPALAMDLREDDTWMFNARHDIQFDGSALQTWNTTVFGSFVDHTMDNLLKPLDPRMLNAQTIATTYNAGGRTEGTWNMGEHKLYAGVDLRMEGAEGIRYREMLLGPMAGNTLEDNAWQDGRILKTGLFAEYQIRGRVFDYVLSGRMTFNNADIQNSATEFTQVNTKTRTTQVNPSLSIGVLKEFGRSIQTGIWVARAQRSGSLTERFINYFPVGLDPYEMIGNPQLDPETNYQTDLTFQWSANENNSIQVDVFAAYLQDYISSVIDPTLSPRLPMSPGVRQFINIDEAFKTGFEVGWNQRLAAGLSHRLGMAYTYGQDLERDEPLPEIAPLDFRYGLQGNYLKDRLKPEIIIRYVSEQRRTSGEFGETTTPSFGLVDIKISYRIAQNVMMNAGVNNLLDADYYEHLNRSVRGSNAPIPAPGRNWFVDVNYTF